MRRFLQELPLPVEFIFVVLGAFGLSILVSLLQMVRPVAQAAVSDEGLHFLIGYELVVLAVLATFLRLRGWTIERFGIRITVRDTLIGLMFVFAAELIGMGALLLIQPISPKLAATIEAAGAASRTPSPICSTSDGSSPGNGRRYSRSAASWRTRSRLEWCAAIRLWMSRGSSAPWRSCGGLSCAEM